MFNNVVIDRGFSHYTFNPTGFSAGETLVVRSPIFQLIQTRIEMALPEPMNETNFMKLAIDPALLYVLQMTRIATMLEIEHENIKSISREEPITMSVGGKRMMVITPKLGDNNLWSASLDIMDGDTLIEHDDMEEQDWNWSQMISMALAYPALSVMGSLGLIDQFYERLRTVDATISISNELIQPGVPPRVTQISGFFAESDNDADVSVAITAEAPEESDTNVVDSEDDFDRAFKRLIAQQKKGGLDA